MHIYIYINCIYIEREREVPALRIPLADSIDVQMSTTKNDTARRVIRSEVASGRVFQSFTFSLGQLSPKPSKMMPCCLHLGPGRLHPGWHLWTHPRHPFHENHLWFHWSPPAAHSTKRPWSCLGIGCLRRSKIRGSKNQAIWVHNHMELQRSLMDCSYHRKRNTKAGKLTL